MGKPGSNPDIPETSLITFNLEWSRMELGKKVPIAHFPTPGNRSMVTFPHRLWNPPIGKEIECALWPNERVIFAVPLGGIPEDEKVEDDSPLEPLSLEEMAVEVNNTLNEVIYKVEEFLNRLDSEAFPPLEESTGEQWQADDAIASEESDLFEAERASNSAD